MKVWESPAFSQNPTRLCTRSSEFTQVKIAMTQRSPAASLIESTGSCSSFRTADAAAACSVLELLSWGRRMGRGWQRGREAVGPELVQHHADVKEEDEEAHAPREHEHVVEAHMLHLREEGGQGHHEGGHEEELPLGEGLVRVVKLHLPRDQPPAAENPAEEEGGPQKH